MKKLVALVCIVLHVITHIYGQTQPVEVLQERITALKSNNIDSAKVLAHEIIDIGRKSNSPRIEVKGNVILADLFYYANEREKGFKYLTGAIDICDKNGLEQLKTDIYYSIGLNYSRNARKSDNSIDKEKMQLALDYHQKGIDLATKYDDLILLSKGYNLSGVCRERLGEFDEALILYQKSEAYSRSANDSIGLGYTLDYAGTLLAQLGKEDEAESMLLEALEIRKKLNDPFAYAINLNNVGEFYMGKGDLNESMPFLEKSLNISFSRAYQDLAMHTAGLLSDVYRELKQFDKALSLKDRQMSIKDSLYNTNRTRIQEEMDTRYETELKERELLEQELEISEQNRRFLLILGVLVIVVIVGLAIYNRQRLRQKQLKTELALKEALAREALIEKLQSERLRLSRDLHDSLGAELTLISSSADNQEYAAADEGTKSAFHGIGLISRNAVSILRDTIWAIRKDALDVEEFSLKLMQFIQQRQSIMKIDVENGIQDHILLTPSQSLNLFRVCQEVIHNAIKHANASNMLISFNNDANYIYVVLQDDGLGMKQEDSSGYGMTNMNERIAEVNGEIKFESKPGKGVTVRISLPREVK